ncbi:MAG: DUF3015 family protein [Oligoflexus sp.]|nr:DUF3015 family protein [Oligoflexus sp.]
MNLKYSVIVLLCSFSFSSLALAKKAPKKKKKSSPKTEATEDLSDRVKGDREDEKEGEKVKYIVPWGMAGCGLASSIIPDKSRGSQIAVWFVGMTLNGTSFANSQSSGISSGTSNCVETKPVFAKEEQKVYVDINLASLSREASQGDGEHLLAFADVLGCPSEEFSKMSQEKYSAIFSRYQSDAVLDEFLREVKADNNLAAACTRVL